MTAAISEVEFGKLADGRPVKLYRLRNTNGAEATFLNLGASWKSFKLAPDEPSLVLGCSTLSAFADQEAYLGATVGRYANRIKNGCFELNGETVQVEVNQEPHHLHGGSQGISGKIWDSHIELVDNQTPTLTFRCFSEHGESGFPGNVGIKLTITLSEDNAVRFHYQATADQPTVLNLTNHAYFNLDGEDSGHLKHHQFKLESTDFLDTDEQCIPSGKITDAKGSPFDFSDWRSINSELETLEDTRLSQCQGYDHCYCYDDDQKLKTLACARSTESNRQIICRSDLPGMQFYTGNFLQGTPTGKGDEYASHSAFCFEPGAWIDSPNHAHFPDCVVDENKAYSAIIEYSFK